MMTVARADLDLQNRLKTAQSLPASLWIQSQMDQAKGHDHQEEVGLELVLLRKSESMPIKDQTQQNSGGLTKDDLALLPLKVTLPLTMKRISVGSTTSSISSSLADNPFISLMSEARVRRTSSVNNSSSTGNVSTLSSNTAADEKSRNKRGVVAMAQQKSLTEETVKEEEEEEIIGDTLRLSMEPVSPRLPPILSPKTRRSKGRPSWLDDTSLTTTSTSTTNTTMPAKNKPFDPVVRRRLIKAKQIQTEAGGSKIFHNYQINILERTTTNPSVVEQAANLNLLSPSVLEARRQSWNPSKGQHQGQHHGQHSDSPFKRHTRARSTWSEGKRSSSQDLEAAREVEARRQSLEGDLQAAGKRAHIKKSFQRLGKMFGGRN